MDRDTVAVYAAQAAEWQARRGGATEGLGVGFRAIVGSGLVADLGCGIGRYFGEIGGLLIGVDATKAMLDIAKHGGEPLVQGDLEALPFRSGQLAGAFARHSYLHVPKERFGAAIAELRRVLKPGGRVLVSMIEGDYEGHQLPGDDFPGRLFACWRAEELGASFRSAGFADVATRPYRNSVLVTAAAPA